jgi:transcriptional regulator with XRE-family HTH domain
MSGSVLNAAERREIGDRIDRLRHAKRLTLTELASVAGYDERTARNVIQGKSTRYKTLMDFCEAVGIKSLEANTDVAQYADEVHGGYSRKSLRGYVGGYSASRWSYDATHNILKSYFEISWSSEHGLVFSENQRYVGSYGKIIDFSQSGEIYANEETGLLHLVTIVEGMVRLITVTRLQSGGMLKGAVLSQAREAFYRRPAVSPIFLQKLQQPLSEDELKSEVGELAPGSPSYDDTAKELRLIEQEILLSTVGRESPSPAKRQLERRGAVTKFPAVQQAG